MKRYNSIGLLLIYCIFMSYGIISTVLPCAYYFIKKNEHICDPKSPKITNVTCDIILLIVLNIIFLTKIFKRGNISKPNLFAKGRRGKYLSLIRYIGAISGIIYFVASWYWDRVPIYRFIILKTRFLTELFIGIWTLYFILIIIYDLFGFNLFKKEANIFFNELFCLNLFGSLFVTIGFWVFIVPYSIYIGYIGLESYTFNYFDLIGHLFNLIFVLIEYILIPKIKIEYTTLCLMLIILCSYSIIMKQLQYYTLICWIPYGPLLVEHRFKIVSTLLVSIGFCIMKRIF